MSKSSKVFVFLIISILFINCNNKENKSDNKESILKGSVSILVDETLTPLIEDQVAVFESKYDAKVKIVSKSESEVVVSLFKEKSGIAILSRKLTVEENKIFEQKKITPKITKFATDAIAFIRNKNNKDTLVDINDVINFMKGRPAVNIKGLVFDNPNSSTIRYIKELANVKDIPETGVFSFKTNQEVIKFVANNKDMVGVIGVNWVSQPMSDMQQYIKLVNVLSLKNKKDLHYYFPSQNNIAEGKYPLARDLYIINAQGYAGLGMGFASFVAGDIGQRIILKSGLLPVRIPGRNIIIRNKINNEKN